MHSVKQIEYSDLRKFEYEIDGNVKVGGYEMDKVCPIEEGRCYQIQLDRTDVSRVWLLREPTFKNLTTNEDYQLRGLLNTVESMDRVAYWLKQNLDLRISTEWSPVFVSKDLNSALVTIDGNHRLMAHFHLHRNVEGVWGYVFVHPNMSKWGFVPRMAR